MSKIIDRVFSTRGYTEDYLKKINTSTNEYLKDIEEMAIRLDRYRKENKKIVVLPDFDMDGIMSAIVGALGLNELGFNVGLYAPDTNVTYGFNEDTIKEIIENFNPDVIITCDVGTSCFEGVAYAKACGIEVIVTDHHKQQYTGLDADVLINPMRVDEDYSHPGICGAFVMYKCIEFYAKYYTNPTMLERIERLRVFAGIGTVSDVMPMLYENRLLVRNSVAICRSVFNEGDPYFVNTLSGSPAYRQAFIGLYNILYSFFEDGKIKSGKDIDEDFFGFYLAPMFNSIRRMGEKVSLAYNIFFDVSSELNIKTLSDLNNERKKTVNLHFKDLSEGYQPYAPYVYVSDARSSILGLLANKLLSTSGLPTLVLKRNEDGSYTGSGRSPFWYKANTKLNENGFSAAGHEQAFGGVHVHNSDELHELYDFLATDVPYEKQLAVDSGVTFYSYDVDLVATKYGFAMNNLDGTITNLSFDDIRYYLHQIRQYKPFGNGFSKPSIKITIPRDMCRVSLIGDHKQHTKVKLLNSIDVLCWNQTADRFGEDDDIKVLGDFSYSEFNDVLSIIFMGDFIN